MKKCRGFCCIAFFALCAFPAVLKFGGAFFIDLRYQTIVPAREFSAAAVIASAGAALLGIALEWELLRRAKVAGRDFFVADLPLAGLAAMWFLPPLFPLLILCIALAAWSAGRAAALCGELPIPRIPSRTAFAVVCVLILLWTAVGTYHQCRSLDTLAMSWFDWGHFFESLNNFFKGKPFHLNLSGGSFLGSRFTPSLVLLLPVVATGSVKLFLFCGSLLVSSGAVFVYLLARSLKFSPASALFWSVWYLFLPCVANMNLPLIDGFHEVFLFFPLILGAVWLAVGKRFFLSAVLIILALGVRETAGIAAAGYGIVLFFKGRRKAGAALFVLSLLWVVIVMKFLMPLFDPPVAGTYAHVGFYSHLGNNVVEIALSPLLRPEAFFSALFNVHTFLFWCTLLLPFVPLIRRAPLMLLPLAPEFVMVSVDRRFDTQSVLRHYQAVIVIVLVTASLFGAAKLREKGFPRDLRLLFAGLKDPCALRGAAGAAFAAAVLSFLVVVQLPGLPASDPQRRYTGSGEIPVWTDVRPAMKRITALIPPGAGVTAGFRLAAQLVPRYDIHFDFSADDGKLQDFILLENFFSFYFQESEFSRRLLASPNWELIHQEFVGERSIQLFRRAKQPVPKAPPAVKIPRNKWDRWGMAIAVPVSTLDVRVLPSAPGRLVFGARLKKECRNDIGFRVTLKFAGGGELKYFTSFCSGRWPADMARPGEGFFFTVNYPPSEILRNCRVDVIDIKSSAAPQ
ncbi:MAG: DUF2079 domain-containing protein [Lentisphaeria bacterium]|nr:DUF2079 domain-containing protein [Lentisphaeria bacterium]